MTSSKEEFDETGPERSSPIPTGFQHLDNLLGNGLQCSEVVILAGCTSFGKSALALNIARTVAGQGKRVGIFSLEQTGAQIEMRLLASETKIDLYRIHIGMVSNNEESRLLDACDTLPGLPIHIDDTPRQTIAYIQEEAHRIQEEHGLDLLIIDYLQLIAGNGHPEYRVQEMSEISRSIKALARELDIPIIAMLTTQPRN